MDKKIKWLICSLMFVFGLFCSFKPVSAMPLGTLLYRTSWRGNAYGYSSKDLLVIGQKGLITDLYTGHVGMYIGKENGVDYIAEALPSGLVKMPAKYFLNKRAGEKLIGAKIPKNITEEQREKVVALARTLTDARMKYDFDFKHQKGSESGQWICVGFTEKVYESANTPNPKNLNTLVYNPDEYGIDITPDGFDNTSIYNSKTGDCFSTGKEFSKIAKRPSLLLPAPEIIGYDAGLENGTDRYFFIPQTQFLQPTLEDVAVDIDLESDFDDEEIRGKTPRIALVFKWSLVNNPSSSLKQLALMAKDKILSLFKSEPALAVSVVENKATTTKKTVTATKTKATTTKKKAVAKTSNAKAKTATTKKISSTLTKANTSTPKVVTTKKATTPPVKTTSPRLNSAVQAKPATSSSPVVSPAVNKVNPVVNPTVNNYNTTVVNNPQPIFKPLILIGEIGEDWIELYNPNNEAVDLADGAYRLEKSKTAVDPGIMMRFGNESDGTYLGGTEIPAEGSYLIVSEDASSELKTKAQAIASNNNFSWGESGYTIYLGSGAISSSADADIVDYVGFGPDAKYYEGSAPAPTLVANSILIRKANANSTIATLKSGGSDELLGHAYDTHKNQSDFVLLNLSPDVVVPDNNNNNNNNNNNSTTSTEVISTSTSKIIISRVYATGDDDYIDLYNDSDIDFDLALNNYRVEKAKSASDPMILMRIGNENDGIYPGGTIIKARSYYRLVRNEASENIKATADAIAIGNNFTFDGSGYAIYLGLDSISAPDDTDIVDMVGFGYDAAYYEGSGPAPEILDEGLLSRKVNVTSTVENMALEPDLGRAYDSDDNKFDFVIIGGEAGSGGPNIGYNSPGLSHLWHFNECRGNILEDSIGSSDFDIPATWIEGKWECALEQYYSNGSNVILRTNLKDNLDSKGLSIAFNFKYLSSYEQSHIFLSGPDGGVKVNFSPHFTQADGLPTIFRNESIKWPADSVWHQGVLVINGANDYWELYLDGKRVYQEYFEAIFSKSFTDLEIGYNHLDEVAIWKRALSGEEIQNIFLSQSELAPVEIRPEQEVPKEIHHWSFDERTGNLAGDDIGGDDLFVDGKQWLRLGQSGAAIMQGMYAGPGMNVDFSKDIKSDDLSLELWWRNQSYPNESRGIINLTNGAKNIFSLIASPYRPGYYFNGDYGLISEGYGATLPHDDAWHHLVLVYDSYERRLNFYVDGELEYSAFHSRFPDEVINGLAISNANFEYSIDDLSIWQGALKASQVKTIYQNETGDN